MTYIDEILNEVKTMTPKFGYNVCEFNEDDEPKLTLLKHFNDEFEAEEFAEEFEDEIIYIYSGTENAVETGLSFSQLKGHNIDKYLEKAQQDYDNDTNSINDDYEELNYGGKKPAKEAYDIQPMLGNIVDKAFGKEKEKEDELTLKDIFEMTAKELAKKIGKKLGVESKDAKGVEYPPEDDDYWTTGMYDRGIGGQYEPEEAEEHDVWDEKTNILVEPKFNTGDDEADESVNMYGITCEKCGRWFDPNNDYMMHDYNRHVKGHASEAVANEWNDNGSPLFGYKSHNFGVTPYGGIRSDKPNNDEQAQTSFNEYMVKVTRKEIDESENVWVQWASTDGIDDQRARKFYKSFWGESQTNKCKDCKNPTSSKDAVRCKKCEDDWFYSDIDDVNTSIESKSTEGGKKLGIESDGDWYTDYFESYSDGYGGYDYSCNFCNEKFPLDLTDRPYPKTEWDIKSLIDHLKDRHKLKVDNMGYVDIATEGVKSHECPKDEDGYCECGICDYDYSEYGTSCKTCDEMKTSQWAYEGGKGSGKKGHQIWMRGAEGEECETCMAVTNRDKDGRCEVCRT